MCLNAFLDLTPADSIRHAEHLLLVVFIPSNMLFGYDVTSWAIAYIIWLTTVIFAQ